MADSGRSRREPHPRLIPVAELLAAQKRIRHPEPAAAPPVPAPPQTSSPQPDASGPALPARQQPGSPAHDDELVRQERQRGRPAGAAGQPAAARHRRRSLLLGAAAAIVLCVGLGVAGVLAGRDAPVPAPPVAGPERITGAKVFRPDVIKASLRGGGAGGQSGQNGSNGGGGGTSAGAGTGTEAAGAEDTADGGERGTTGNGTEAPGRSGQEGAEGEGADGVSQGQQGAAGDTGTTGAPGQQPGSPEQPAPATTSGTEPLAPGSDPVLNTILRFYATAPTQPAIAFGLLHPSVQDGTLADFAASWQGISSAQVLSATPAGTHAMTVRVLLLRTDGTRLLTTQRIEVRGGARPRIVDAQLLSASAG